MSTRNIQHYDVVIAGARCAGAATALLLARQGARVLLLDKSRYGTDTLSTHALMRGAVLQLHRWGLLPGVVEAGTPPVRSTTFHLRGRRHDRPDQAQARCRGAVCPAPHRPGHDPGRRRAQRRRRRAVRYLGHRPAARPGRAGDRDHRPGRRVTPGGQRRSGHRRRRPPLDRRAVRRRPDRPRRARPRASLIYRYVRDDAPDDYHWYFRDGAAAGVIPTNDGLACVFAATSAERLPRELDGGADAAWRRILDRAAPGLVERLDSTARPVPRGCSPA